MAKKKQSGEGKAGIIIVLAFFMLVSAVLGYLTYEFYSQIEEANKGKADAAQEAVTAKKLTGEEQERVAFYRQFLGLATKDEQDVLKALKEDGIVRIRKDHTELMQSINTQIDATVKAESVSMAKFDGKEFKLAPTDRLTWTWPEGGALPAAPSKSLAVWAVEAMANRDLFQRRVTQRVSIAEELEKKLEEEKKAYLELKDKLAEVVKKIPEDAKAQETARDKQLETRLKEFATYMQQYRLGKGEIEAKQNELRAVEEKAQGLFLQIKELTDKLAAKDAEKEDLFAYDTPKGSIEARRRRENLVEINLGSSDNVKPGLTFYVMPLEVKERGLQSRTKTTRVGNKDVTRIEPKGYIEVLEVLGPNLSTARITYEESPIRESIMKTDLLFNAAWRRGQPDHIALAGVFDVDGDGTDDIKQVERELSRMGIIVDGYFDLVTRKWVGGGPTKKTNTVVVGDYPQVTSGDALVQLKTELGNIIYKARQEAVNEGAKAVSHRDFFPRIGYNTKLDVTDERINQAAAKFLRAPVEAPADPPK